ncbi:hypothetical protein C900_01379 [Fulvivirga imtechensis AK7]|uniref:Uncharacterized protein n=1 Tax=Fulvivirga imtechensis AK7 TaxID=1237149 RepID=L8K1H5_9BACT|nr:hypothetical protein C900_01379 [Fulvivirga imtechensis AK7]
MDRPIILARIKYFFISNFLVDSLKGGPKKNAKKVNWI